MARGTTGKRREREKKEAGISFPHTRACIKTLDRKSPASLSQKKRVKFADKVNA